MKILHAAILLAVPAVLVLKQPDLGTALILVLITSTLVFVGGLNWRTMATLMLGAVLVAPVAWHYLKPYQRERLVSFMNPQSDPLGSGYHIIQSEIAIGSGGAWGKGLFKGTQARLNFLPEQTTDFIFAVFAEEFGFAGSMALLGLYTALIARGAWIARHARDRRDGNNLLAGRDQYRDGDRDAAGGRDYPAAGQLWRLIADRHDDRDGPADQHQYQTISLLVAIARAQNARQGGSIVGPGVEMGM